VLRHSPPLVKIGGPVVEHQHGWHRWRVGPASNRLDRLEVAAARRLQLVGPMNQSLCAAAIGGLAILASASPASADDCTTTSMQETWDGDRVNQVRLAATGGTALLSWHDAIGRSATLDAGGGLASQRATDASNAIGTYDAIASSPRLHLVVDGGGGGPLVGRRLGPDGSTVGGSIVIDAAGSGSAPVVAFDGTQFIVGWARATADYNRWEVQVATIGEGAGGPVAPLLVAPFESGLPPRLQLVPVDGVTWILMKDAGDDSAALTGARLDTDGALVDEAPVALGHPGRLIAAASVGGRGLVIVYSGGVRAHAIDADGLTAGPSAPLGLATEAVIALTPSPDRNGYVLWSSDAATGDDFIFPMPSGTTTGRRLDLDGSLIPGPDVGSFVGAQPNVVLDGRVYRYAAVEESKDDSFSRLRSGVIAGAGNDPAPVTVADQDVEHVIETICHPSLGDGCSAAGAGTGAVAVLIAALAVALPRHRRAS
jgi:hypothetical protein